ncbi:MAG: polysaccharide biosynthesis C-terminal domain-containing protein [Spirochaetales bacterium]|nr:polysaccharide biosynthesis C-terminal domain-containing protein [Candidatus Physcosoma equi]
MDKATNKGDFSQGSIFNHILRLALPYILAEFVHVMYNIVDRMFIGHIPEIGTLALSGVGIVFPIISFINAFAGLWSTGGAPLCSIHRGKGDNEGAHDIMETCFTLLLVNAVVIMLVLFPTMKWTLHWMGADESTYAYAKDYFSIYLLGTVFTYISLGANPFINMQGNSIVGMMTVLLGAAINIILDPIFIFVLGMGVKGAAWATVISQFCSALWAVTFLVSKRASVRLRKLCIKKDCIGKVFSLGVSGFMFKMTNSITQGVANITLSIFGGTMGTFYIGAMSIINSMREVVSLPITAMAHSAQQSFPTTMAPS